MKFLPALCVAATLLVVTNANADPKGGHKNKKHSEKQSNLVAIPSSDQSIIRDYLRDNYGSGHCPPGLAKKNNGCLPPGQAKKYRVGGVLQPDLYGPLPGDLLMRLHPVAGYQYVQVDQDVVLIGEASKKVIDAITLLSAVQ